MGKRIVVGLEGELFLVLHLMIAGRLRWLGPKDKPPGRITLALLDFDNGTLAFTEAGTKRRASLHLVQGEAALRQFDMGGLEVLDVDLASFAQRLKKENHTLKRALTDPHIFSGIGNAYSDEILHRAKLSPVALSANLGRRTGRTPVRGDARRVAGLDRSDCARMRRQKFPEKVTAFREGMAVHGRFGQPCPVCGAPVQRIVHAENETNYCARCQTGGKLLADRALSRLLHKSWPRNLDELD